MDVKRAGRRGVYLRGGIANKIEFYVAASPTRFAVPPLPGECFIISSAHEWLFRGAVVWKRCKTYLDDKLVRGCMRCLMQIGLLYEKRKEKGKKRRRRKKYAYVWWGNTRRVKGIVRACVRWCKAYFSTRVTCLSHSRTGVINYFLFQPRRTA